MFSFLEANAAIPQIHSGTSSTASFRRVSVEIDKQMHALEPHTLHHRPAAGTALAKADSLLPGGGAASKRKHPTQKYWFFWFWFVVEPRYLYIFRGHYFKLLFLKTKNKNSVQREKNKLGLRLITPGENKCRRLFFPAGDRTHSG